MGNLYTTIQSLCEAKGIRPGRLCSDLGLSRGLMTDLKMGRKTGVSAVTAQKIAGYFNVSVAYLLGEEEQSVPTERAVSDEEIKFALFGGDGEITDEMFDEVKRFAQMVKLREATSAAGQTRTDTGK